MHLYISEIHANTLVYKKGGAIKHIKAQARVKVLLPDLRKSLIPYDVEYPNDPQIVTYKKKMSHFLTPLKTWKKFLYDSLKGGFIMNIDIFNMYDTFIAN